MHARSLRFSLLLLFCLAGPALAETEEDEPLFRNMTEALGLGGVKAKDGCFVDLDGDGFWDLVLDRQRFFLSKGGKKFVPHESHGVPYPQTTVVPLGKDGKSDESKAKTRPFVPQYLYFADLDNNGKVDALWGVHSMWDAWGGRGWTYVAGSDHGHRSQVLLGKGGGKFTDADGGGYAAKDAAGPAMAMAILDFDRDGVLDLYEGREYRQYGVLYGCGVDRLWKGDGAGAFTDVTEAAGLMTRPEPGTRSSSRPSYGVTHGDMNGDGWQDLLQMAYGRQWNYHWRNNGDGTFTEVGHEDHFDGDDITHGRYPTFMKRDPEQPFRSNGNTFDCAIGDHDNDGDLDIFLGGICHFWAGEASDLPSLLVNGGGKEPVFERRTVREFLPKRESRSDRWNFGDLHAAWLDYDNDTRLDLLIGSGDYPDGQFLRLYRQQEDGTFEEVTKAAGFQWEGCGGLSIGDFDRDGDVDIMAGRSFARLDQKHRDQFMNGITVNEVGLFRNDVGAHAGNHWLNVRLVGKGKGGCNRMGIGCRVRVTTGDVTQTREIRCGSGLSNHQDPPEACFGLGKATKVDKLEIWWCNQKGTRQEFKNVPANRFVVAHEGRSKPKLAKAKAGAGG